MIKSAPSKVYTIWDTIQIFYYVVKSFCYITFSVDGKIENGKIKSTVFDVVTVFGANIALTFIIYINFEYDLSLISTKSFIIDMGNRGVTLFMIMNVFVSSMINSLRRHEIWSFFTQLHEFDGEVD